MIKNANSIKTDNRTITEMRQWNSSDVIQMCIKHDWYTCGTCAEYEKMLDFVRDNSYSLKNAYYVARDIARHSDLTTYGYALNSTEPEAIESILWAIGNEAVNIFYGIEEDSEPMTAENYFR